MDRRLFLLMGLASCADPAGGVARQPSPPPPPIVPLETSGDPAFDAWREGYRVRAQAAGISAQVLAHELAGLTPDPRVTSLDGRQPEFSRPVGTYIQGVVSDRRVATGRERIGLVTQLGAIAERSGVPAEILAGIWGMETNFGDIQGDMDVIRSLATLAAQGRRRGWAEGELNAALTMITSGAALRSQLIGSWAGAMGQSQFLPTTYLRDAVDGDGDGRKDIWGSAADALASAANLLAKAGWQRGGAWHREVTLPRDFDFSLAESVREPPAGLWTTKNIRPSDGNGWSAGEAGPAQLYLPSGAKGPAFLLFANHFIIRRYNNSASYALAVGLLADRFAGKAQLSTPWPVETPLSLADRVDTQRALAALGFDPGGADGVIGTNSRKALRAWQGARGLPADGYLSPDIVARLRNEAAALIPPPAPATTAIP